MTRDPHAEQLKQIAKALEKLPDRLARELHKHDVGREQQPSLGRQVMERQDEARRTARAERRANIAIALTGVTALGSLIAAIATLLQG